jgi:hypothetical protein
MFAHRPELGTFWCPLGRCALAATRVVDSADAPAYARVTTQISVLAVLCFLLDIGVIGFHISMPVHPKFLATRTRARVIRVHILSGAVQCTLGPVIYALYLYGGPTASAQWQATIFILVRVLVALCVALHVTTAAFLMRTPFGAVRIMLPAFVYVLGMYCYTLGELAFEADYADLGAALLAWWLMLHIDALNRLVVRLLTRFNLLASTRYTLSVVLGVAISAPPALGVMSFVLLLGALAVFNMVFLLAMDRADRACGGAAGYSSGRTVLVPWIKRHFVTPEGAVFARSLKAVGAAPLGPREAAQVVFKALDVDGSGRLELANLARLLVRWGLPSSAAATMIRERDTNGDGLIGFDEFVTSFSDVWQFAAAIVLGNAMGDADSDDGAREGAALL